MVKTITFNTEIPADRELRITLPADVPAGSAAVVVTVSSPGPSTASTFGDLLNSEFFGMWRGRAALRIRRSSRRNCGQRAGSGAATESDPSSHLRRAMIFFSSQITEGT